MPKSAAERARANRRATRAQQPQDTNDHVSTMDFDIPDQEDDERRRNTSSEDEADDGDKADGLRQLATTGNPIDPKVADLVKYARQMLGSSGVDGTAFALAAATTAPSATEALDLLAASSAVANLRVDRASSLAAHAVAESNVATEGLRNSDHTYDNRFKQYDRQLRLRDLEVEQLQNRVTVLEGLLCRVLAMMLNGTFDAAEIGQMLQKLRI